MTVLNEAVGGTTSVQWAAGDTMKNALAKAPDAKNIIFLIGGNDFMGAKCTPTRAQMKTTVLKSLQKMVDILKAAGKNPKITMLGYPVPTAKFPTAEGECPGSSPSALEKLNGGVEDACKQVGATYIDMSTLAGGSSTSWSPLAKTKGAFHVDQVHLNAMGYCKLSINDKYRARMGCSVK